TPRRADPAGRRGLGRAGPPGEGAAPAARAGIAITPAGVAHVRRGKDVAVPETSGSTGRTPETHVIDFRAAEQLLASRDPRGAVKLLDGVIDVYPENTAARLLRARAFFARSEERRVGKERRCR